MFNLEDKLIPTPDRHTPRRDALVVGLLLVLTLPLLSGWFRQTGQALGAVSQLRRELAAGKPDDPKAAQIGEDLAAAEQNLRQQVRDLASRTFSPLLLAAMGFALALRRGAVDLSVWVTAGVGAMLGANVLRLPWQAIHTTVWAPLLAMPLAAAAGGAIGLANGLLTTRRRWPAPLATGALAGAIWLGLRLTHCPDSIPVAELAFDKVSQSTGLPLWMFRVLVVVLGGGGVSFAVLALGGQGRLMGPRGVVLALCASGALAGLAGAVRLLETSQAFRPRLVEDLRVPAAALLAGAGILAGRGKTTLACLFVPLGVILANEWMLQAYDWQVGGYHVQMAILIAMILGSHKALSLAGAGAGRAWAGLASCAVGMLLVAVSGGARPQAEGLLFLGAGVALWTIGLAVAWRPGSRPEAR